jgi:hypothetical protein
VLRFHQLAIFKQRGSPVSNIPESGMRQRRDYSAFFHLYRIRTLLDCESSTLSIKPSTSQVKLDTAKNLNIGIRPNPHGLSVRYFPKQ